MLHKQGVSKSRIAKELGVDRKTVDRGYAGSYDTVKRYIREIRPPRPAEAFVRFETEPGEQSQVDWGSFGLIRHQGQMKRLYCFSLLLCYSRYYRLVVRFPSVR